MCQICVKHLKSGPLDPEIRQIAVMKLQNLATISFEQKSMRHKQNLFQALKYRPSLRILIRCLLASMWRGGQQF